MLGRARLSPADKLAALQATHPAEAAAIVLLIDHVYARTKRAPALAVGPHPVPDHTARGLGLGRLRNQR